MPEFDPLRRKRLLSDPNADPTQSSHLPGYDLKPITESIAPVDTGPLSPSSLLGAIPEKSTLPPTPDILPSQAVKKRTVTGKVASTIAPTGQRSSNSQDAPFIGRPNSPGTIQPKADTTGFGGNRVTSAFSPEMLANYQASLPKTGKIGQSIANQASAPYQQARSKRFTPPPAKPKADMTKARANAFLPPEQLPEEGNTYIGAGLHTAADALKSLEGKSTGGTTASDMAHGLADLVDNASAGINSTQKSVKDWMLRKTGLDKNDMASDLVQYTLDRVVNPMSIPGQDYSGSKDAATTASNLLNKVDPTAQSFIGRSGFNNTGTGGFLSGFKEGIGFGAVPSDRLSYNSAAGTTGKTLGNIAGLLLPGGAIEKGAASLTGRAVAEAPTIAQNIGTRALTGAGIGAVSGAAKQFNPDTADPKADLASVIGGIGKEAAIQGIGNVLPGIGRNWWQRGALGAIGGAGSMAALSGGQILPENATTQDYINLGVNVGLPALGGAVDSSYQFGEKPSSMMAKSGSINDYVPTIPAQEPATAPIYGDLTTKEMNPGGIATDRLPRTAQRYNTTEMAPVESLNPSDLVSRKFADVEASPDVPYTDPSMMGKKNREQYSGEAATPKAPLDPNVAAGMDTQRLVDTIAPFAGKQSWDIRASNIQDAISELDTKLSNGEITPQEHAKDLASYEAMLNTANKAKSAAESTYKNRGDIGAYNEKMNMLGIEYGRGGAPSLPETPTAPPKTPIKPKDVGTAEAAPISTPTPKVPEKGTVEAAPIKPPEKGTVEATEPIKPSEVLSNKKNDIRQVTKEFDKPENQGIETEMRDAGLTRLDLEYMIKNNGKPDFMKDEYRKGLFQGLSPEAQNFISKEAGNSDLTVRGQGQNERNANIKASAKPEAVQNFANELTKYASPDEAYRDIQRGKLRSKEYEPFVNSKIYGSGIPANSLAQFKAFWNKNVKPLKEAGAKPAPVEKPLATSKAPISKPDIPSKATQTKTTPVVDTVPAPKLVDSEPTVPPASSKPTATDVVKVKASKMGTPISSDATINKPAKPPKVEKLKLESVDVEGRAKERATPQQATKLRELTDQYNQKISDATEDFKDLPSTKESIRDQEKAIADITRQYHDAVDTAMGRQPKSESPAEVMRRQLAEKKQQAATAPKPEKPAKLTEPIEAKPGTKLTFTDPVNKKTNDVEIVNILDNGKVKVRGKNGYTFTTEQAHLSSSKSEQIVYNKNNASTATPISSLRKEPGFFSKIFRGDKKSQQGSAPIEAVAGFPAAKALKQALTDKGVSNEVLPNGTATKDVRPQYSRQRTVQGSNKVPKEVTIGGKKLRLDPKKIKGQEGFITTQDIANASTEVKRLMKAGATSVSNAIAATKDAVFPYVSPAERTPFAQGILSGLKANKLWKSVARDLVGTGAYIGMKGAQRVAIGPMDVAMSRLLSKERAAQGFSIQDTLSSAKEGLKGGKEAIQMAFNRKGLSPEQLAKLELSETKTGIRPLDWTTNTLQNIRGAVDHVNHTYARHRALLELMWQDAHSNLTQFGSDGKVSARPSNKDVRSYMSDQMDKYLKYKDGTMSPNDPDFGTMQAYHTVSDQIGNELTFNNENAVATNINKAKKYLYDKGYDGSKASMATAMLLDYKAPFVRANTNIMYQMLKHTPGIGQAIDLAEVGKLPGGSGGIKNKLNTIINSQTGRKLFSQSVANGATGAFLSYVGWQLAKDKKYVPYFQYDPDNPKGKETAIKNEAEGRYEGSINMNGYSIRLKDIPILGESLMMGGNAYLEYSKAAKEGKPARTSDAIRGARDQAWELVKGMPYLDAAKGISRLASGESIGQNLLNEVSGIPVQFVPNILEAAYTPAAKLAGYNQALKREPEKGTYYASQLEQQGYDPSVAAILGAGQSAYQQFKERIPGVRESLAPKLTAYGQEQPLSPIWEMAPTGLQNNRNNPIIQELDRLGIGETKMQRNPGESILDYNKRLRIAGGLQMMMQQQMLQDPSYYSPVDPSESEMPVPSQLFQRNMMKESREQSRKQTLEDYQEPDFSSMRDSVINSYNEKKRKEAEKKANR